MTTGVEDFSNVQASEPEGVVAGYDGSASASTALEWAAEAAQRYGVPLTLLTARPDAAAVAQEASTEDPLAVVAARLTAQRPELQVRAEVHPGSPVEALLAASRTADAIVIGSRGLEGFRGLLLGSTTMQVAPYASCPVVVLYQPDDATAAARSSARHPDEVVVGYDGSDSAELALNFALRHAKAFGLGVAVVFVQRGRGDGSPASPIDADREDIDAEIRALFEQARSTAAGEPSVAVTYVFGSGRPSAVLIAEAAGAPLAVVGARGRGGFSGLVLGSVSQKMLMHAECPVAVVHGSAESR